MRKIRLLFSRLGGLFNKRRKDRELEEEIESHLRFQTEENLRLGLPQEEARREALVKFGAIESTKDAYRDQRGLPVLETLWQDIRFGARMMQKSPGFTVVAVLTLALGIGANTAIFSVINAIIVRPLPFREPDRLVWIADSDNSGGLSGTTTQVGNYSDWREINRSLNHSFTDLCGYFAFFDYSSYLLTGAGEPERLHGVGITQNFLQVVGVQPKLGRSFSDEECRWNGPKAIILTDGFWRTRFAGQPSIVGKSISLNNDPSVVAGVLPSTFDFSSVFTPGVQVDFVTPFPICDETDRWGNTLSVIGRLKPGASIPVAQAEFDIMNRQVGQAHPNRNFNPATLTALRSRISGNFRRSFAVLFCAVGSVLLIACANLSNLLLARAAARRKETAVRSALGASRARLVQQMLTESLLVSVSGAVLGLPLAIYATHQLAGLRGFNIPLLQTVTVDVSALIFTVVIAVMTGVIVGIIPAFQMAGPAVAWALKDSSRGITADVGHARMRDWLVVSEVAMAFALLVGAGLFLRSFARLMDVDLGFKPAATAAWRIETLRNFPNMAEENVFYKDLVARIENVPGVESAGLTDSLPLGRNRSWSVGAKGVTYKANEQPVAFPRVVDAGYIHAMRIPLLAGRDFDAHDTPQSEPVLIVNEKMAKGLWPGKDAVGQIVVVGGAADSRVVGVVRNVRHSALEAEAGPEMYLLGAQNGWSSMDLVVRSRGSVAAIAPAVRAALRQVDPNTPTAKFQTLDDIVDQSVSPRRFITLLLTSFSFVALILASLGIYAVIAYSVSQRTHEIGVRLALGASARNVLLLIIRQGILPVLIGLAVGIAGTVALGHVLSNQLYGVSPTDPFTYLCVISVLLLVAFAACCFPARRATKVDPMVALRNE